MQRTASASVVGKLTDIAHVAAHVAQAMQRIAQHSTVIRHDTFQPDTRIQH